MRTRIPRPPRWRARFLRALAEYGNVQLACDKALVHHSYLYRMRASDPLFAAEWNLAKADAAKAFSGCITATPAGKCWHSDGSGLVVTSGKSGAPRRAERARAYRWTRADEIRFLDALASTCNVNLACEAAGHHTGSAYARRSRWPGFAAEWKVALINGLQAFDLRLLHDANERIENGYVGVPKEVAVQSITDAISLLAYHKKQSVAMRPAWNAKPFDVETVKQTIVRQAAALNAAGKRRPRFAGELR